MKSEGLRAVHAASMNDCYAWLSAAMDAGVPGGAIPSENFLTLIVTVAEMQGISKVRWNLRPFSNRLEP